MKQRFKVGDHVMVTDAADETADRRLIGRCGIVIALDTTGDCGSSPRDPFYSVRFALKIAWFWREELSPWPLAECQAQPSHTA